MPGWGYEDALDEIATADAQQAWRKTSANGYNGHDPDWRAIELLSFADMKPRLDRRTLVKGWLDHEQISLLMGESGCGKTFLALDISLHVAAGADWFGHRVKPGAVVYVAAEAGRGIINRVAAFKLAHPGYGFRGVRYVRSVELSASWSYWAAISRSWRRTFSS